MSIQKFLIFIYELYKILLIRWWKSSPLGAPWTLSHSLSQSLWNFFNLGVKEYLQSINTTSNKVYTVQVYSPQYRCTLDAGNEVLTLPPTILILRNRIRKIFKQILLTINSFDLVTIVISTGFPDSRYEFPST